MKSFFFMFNAKKSILSRLFVALLIVMLVTFLFFLSIWNNSLQNVIETLSLSHVYDLIKNSNQRFENDLYNAITSMKTLSESYPMKDHIANPTEETKEALLEYMRVSASYLYDNINGISILCDRDILSVGQIYISEQFFSTESYQNILNNGGDYLVFSRRPSQYADQTVISLGRLIENVENIPVVVIFDFNSSMIVSSFGRLNMDGKLSTLLVNENNEVVFTTNVRLTQEDIASLTAISETQAVANSFSTVMIGDEAYLMLSKKLISAPRWTTITFFPRKIFFDSYRQALQRTLWFLGISLLLMILVSAAISSRMSKKLQTLCHRIEGIQLYDMDPGFSFQELKGEDEISTISQKISEMYNTITHQANTISSLENEKRLYELQILRAQLNPHFLYNTLGTIKTLAELQSNSSIAEITQSTIDLLRYSVTNIDKLVTLQDEISYIKSYVNVVQGKLLNPIRLIINIDDNLLRCLTVKMCLQPIVENSIKHGFSDEVDKYIMIKALVSESGLTIKIIDNGKGIAPDKLTGILKTKNNAHIGLVNVNNRIKLIFGKEYGLSITSIPHVQTTVLINIPYIEDES